jgi:hypothetical protein
MYGGCQFPVISFRKMKSGELYILTSQSWLFLLRLYNYRHVSSQAAFFVYANKQLVKSEQGVILNCAKRY